MILFKSQKGTKLASWFLSCLMMVPFVAACGGGSNQQTRIDDARIASAPNGAPNAPARPKKQGLSTGQKAAVTLAGAAALYYLYNQHKKSQAAKGQQPQYYMSKNGRVYYRDAQKRVQWVTPPREGIQVPASEARQYEQFQGYNNRPSGRDLTSLPEARSAGF
ncbi:hypothetical protein H6F51_24525 [Cyanobacteria bacterium FACHB-DQ100]|uniref:hypothetical protein n=1 Tax=unclassified Leptolyngbya TaxID=2650499 RepID=UPI001681A6B6|nr:hypothetical protein [Leptolyngbya sp. FACHB-17]MBD1825638.1 hypothetical protein [Cyanobacteria bacterium FACHB-DQ100]MBD2079670.1 hypothetical protein [Leptolyngbya sp. FACHB-17]